MVSEPVDGPAGQGRPELDLLPTDRVVDLLLDAEARIVPAVRAAAPGIVAAAEVCAERLRRGGRLVFVGAGTSGRIAAAEAAELPGTFGLPRSRVLHRVAGGSAATDDDEDDLDAAEDDARALALRDTDVVVAVAASGSTPYTLAMARAARAREAAVVAVVTAPGSPLAELATVVIEAVVGPEVLRGSTRLGAGTAQKIALNALTTAAMVRYGRVHGDLMIDMVAANAKLRGRAESIVSTITGAPGPAARSALDACDGDARAAVLVIELGLSPAAARVRAGQHATLRAALGRAEISDP
jgi:N-acetylmuramic acid 6-phosphate etherase